MIFDEKINSYIDKVICLKFVNGTIYLTVIGKLTYNEELKSFMVSDGNRSINFFKIENVDKIDIFEDNFKHEGRLLLPWNIIYLKV